MSLGGVAETWSMLSSPSPSPASARPTSLTVPSRKAPSSGKLPLSICNGDSSETLPTSGANQSLSRVHS